jgi:hypothetical protein
MQLIKPSQPRDVTIHRWLFGMVLLAATGCSSEPCPVEYDSRNLSIPATDRRACKPICADIPGAEIIDKCGDRAAPVGYRVVFCDYHRNLDSLFACDAR